MKKATREILAVLVNNDHKVVLVQEVYKLLKDYVELLVSNVLLECKDLLVLLVDKANVAQNERFCWS